MVEKLILELAGQLAGTISCLAWLNLLRLLELMIVLSDMLLYLVQVHPLAYGWSEAEILLLGVWTLPELLKLLSLRVQSDFTVALQRPILHLSWSDGLL